MIRILKILVCVVSLLSLVGEVFAIKCWDCDSQLDPKCGVPFDNSTIKLKDCSDGLELTDEIPNFCLTHTKIVNGVKSYRRGCGHKKSADDMQCATRSSMTNQGEILFFSEYCPCFGKDGCNNSENESPSL